MKTLFLFLTLLTACGGAPFEATDFTPTTDAGGSGSQAGAIGSGLAGEAGTMQVASGGTASTGGSAGASGAAAGAAQAGSAGASEGGAASGGSAGASDSAGAAGSPVFVTPPCSSPRNVTGGYDASFGAGAACLRTKEPVNTIGCSNWDNRSVTVNGAPAICGVRTDFPPAIDGYNYISLGQGSSTVSAIRWFLTVPSDVACSARSWVSGELYMKGQIAIDICDTPGSGKACVLGQRYAFSCEIPGQCTSQQPGGGTWTAAWSVLSTCG